jgi:hypothetical protein
MSDNWLQFIPTDPEFQPSTDSAETARRLLASFVPEADEVNAEFKPYLEFFHPGGNWSGVKCPACATDLEAWWNDAMATASETAFRDLSVTTPCCGAVTSLNDLTYVWPAGFARFVLEAMNPNVENLTLAQEEQLAKRLGGRLRKIWVHI